MNTDDSAAQSTKRLLSSLCESKNIEDFLLNNQDSLINTRLSDYLYTLLEQYQMNPADLIKQTQIERSYIYHILSGKRIPSRDTVLQIIFALGLTLEEAQLLLLLSKRSVLYSKFKQDAAIIFCISKKLSLTETNAVLSDLGLTLIGADELI